MNRYVRSNSLLELLEQVDDLRLDRDVERRDRLVGDDEVGVERERARDADALALAARELVRVARRRVGRQPDDLEQLRGRARSRRAGSARPCVADGSPMIRPDGMARVERRERVLEDHLHPPPQRPQVASPSS